MPPADLAYWMGNFVRKLYVTGSGKTRLLEQTKMLVINVPNDRAEHCLHNDMLSVHIPNFIPELCALETRSRKCSIEKNGFQRLLN